MRILVVGSGGREHAICLAFSKSPKVSKLFCANGNAGIASIAECVAIKPEDIEKLAEFASENNVDMTFIGGETPLAMGVVDEFESRGLKVIGASKAAARLEASKAFSKDFMIRHGVPTAEYYVAETVADARAVLEQGRFGGAMDPAVVKADGLAAGKGVIVAPNRLEALKGLEELESIAGKDATNRIVIEECLTGREVSLIMFCDGKSFALMPPTRDHKRIGDGDKGPNTGGMGTITDASLLTDDQTSEIVETVIKPTLEGCIAEGFPFRGILFLGLMMTPEGPKVLEYNVRFGDPETQAILVRLQTDLVDVCEAMIAGTLDGTKIEWLSGSSACVILAAEGYPSKPRTGDVIEGLGEAANEPDVTVFHAGTTLSDSGDILTAGGRVVGVTATGHDLTAALDKAYAAAGKISWPGMQYRKDIGK